MALGGEQKNPVTGLRARLVRVDGVPVAGIRGGWVEEGDASIGKGLP